MYDVGDGRSDESRQTVNSHGELFRFGIVVVIDARARVHAIVAGLRVSDGHQPMRHLSFDEIHRHLVGGHICHHDSLILPIVKQK